MVTAVDGNHNFRSRFFVSVADARKNDKDNLTKKRGGEAGGSDGEGNGRSRRTRRRQSAISVPFCFFCFFFFFSVIDAGKKKRTDQ